MQMKKMDGPNYRWFIVVASCALILYITLLLSTNLNYHSPYKSMKPLQNRMREPEFTYNSENDTLVNLYNFKFIMNNASLCMDSVIGTYSSIVIMVHSARSNFNQRYAIRNTWGSVKVFKQFDLHLIFLLGSDPRSPELEAQLWEESKQHGDIIMGNFVDSYRNLSYKHLMGYKWVSTFCPTARFILKTDDDIYADIFHIIDVYVAELFNSKKTYYCENMRGNNPIREVESKWYVSKDQYPDENYPEFCSGSAYLMNADDAAKIYSVSNETNFLWVDDVFVTGVLREKYNLLSNNSNQRSLEIFTLYNRHHLGDKTEIISWCSGAEMNQLHYSFILLNRKDFISDMFCIWNKNKLIRCCAYFKHIFSENTYVSSLLTE